MNVRPFLLSIPNLISYTPRELQVSQQNKSNRRDFLKKSALIAVPYFVPRSVLGGAGETAPSDRIVMGAIGVGKQGRGDLRGFLNRKDTQMVAVCDVNGGSRNGAKGDVDKRNGNKDCTAYIDFRELLAREDIDAVMVATPHHWHAAMTVEACKKGKDVYCEKPLALTIHEGRAMVTAARKYERVVSGGSQRVRGDYAGIAQAVRSGGYGEVKEVYVSCGSPPIRCDLAGQPEPKPEEFHWNLWLGPAPQAAYNKHRTAGNFTTAAYKSRSGWRLWRDYSGGALADWGGHVFGAAQFALEMDDTGPVEIIPPSKDNKHLAFRYANGITMYHVDIYKHGGGNGVKIVGTESKPRKQGDKKIELPNYQGQGGIFGDFIACVKNRTKPVRDVEVSHRTSSVCQLANIAYELGRPLKWDPEKEEFKGDEEANGLRSRAFRSPWTI
jgi:predicted dehydrogenase